MTARPWIAIPVWLVLLGGVAVTGAEPPASAPADGLVDAELRARLLAYLEDINVWILQLDVGSGKLKNTKDTATSIFINGNFARVLLASHRITGRPEYLKEALRWSDGFCKQQETTTTADGRPAGFWSDLGPGRNIYFGDMGTAATSLAMTARFVDEPRRAEYLAAMERMARFVMHGCATDPQGKDRDATASWIIREGRDAGALGCGYYAGHLSLPPYTISTATTGGAFFSSLYKLTGRPEYRDVASGAVRWLLKLRRPDGEIPYTLDGKTETIWPLDTITYCTEGFVATDLHLDDPALRALMGRELKPTIEWLLARQNSDGSWGELRSQDQQRSPGVATLLTWYHRHVAPDPRVAEAVRGYCRFLLDAENSRAYGIKELVRTTGFVGLVVADLLKPGSTF